MKRIIVILILLALMLCGAALAEGPVPFACEEQGYATLVDPAWRCEWVDGDGVYYHFTDDNMPYVLAWVNAGDSRVTDGAAFLEEELADLMEAYRANGAVSTALHGSFAVAGRDVAAADVQYHNSQGYLIYLLIVADVREDYTAIFRCRYFEDDQRQQVLDALDVIDGNLSLTAAAAAEAAPQIDAAPQTDAAPQAAGESGAMAFAVTNIEQGGMTMGRCTAPAGYSVNGQATCDAFTYGAGNPWQLNVSALSPDGTTLLGYISPRNYVSNTSGDTPDGQYSTEYFTPMLHYMDAAAYCDYQAGLLTDVKTIELVEENTYPELQDILRRRETALLQAHAGLLSLVNGVSVDKVVSTIATRRYHVEMTNGLSCCFCVTAVTEGTWYTLSMPGIYVNINDSYIMWDLPCVYFMLCPEAQTDAGIAAFNAFSENTSASDQFLLANRRLSDELWNIINGRGTTYANSYSDDVMREETSKGSDYDDERFTDYLFDQNDYTLSNGSHVKVSSAYDYVYEGDDGNVYYSDSAFAQPGGSTQLYPNK